MSRWWRDEQGTVTAFVATFVVAILAVTGLVIDGGRVLTARQLASDQADAAARAGAQALDEAALRGDGLLTLDPVAARHRALAYLDTTGHDGTVDVVDDTVYVEVRFQRDLSVLGMFGLGPATVTGTGTARGIRGPDPGGS